MSAAGDVIRWSASQDAGVMGDLGMDTATGRPNAVVGGVLMGLAAASEIPATKAISLQGAPNSTSVVSSGGAPGPATGGSSAVVNTNIGQWITYTSSATENSDAGWVATSFDQIQRQYHGRFDAFVLTGGDLSSVRIWVGLFSGNPMASSAPSGVHLAGFRYDTSVGDTGWKCVSSNGSNFTVVGGASIGTNTGYYMRIFFDRANDLIRFSIGTMTQFGIRPSTFVVSTNMPAPDQNLGYCIRARTLVAASRALGISRMCIWQHPVLL
jgi:hypothetical protein